MMNKCPFCNIKMEDAGDDFMLCPECGWCTNKPQVEIPEMLDFLKHYENRTIANRDAAIHKLAKYIGRHVVMVSVDYKHPAVDLCSHCPIPKYRRGGYKFTCPVANMKRGYTCTKEIEKWAKSVEAK